MSLLHVFYGIIVIQEFLHRIGAIATPAFDWAQEAGVIRVLAGNNASLTWIYNGPDIVDLEWSYKGTPENPRSDVILLFKKGKEIPYGDNAARLRFDRFNRSASFIIEVVRVTDQGIYEVKAIHPKEPAYIDSRATLMVYQDIEYNITIDETTHMLSLSNNGTDIVLPTYKDYLPRTFDVISEVSQSSPSSLITLEKWVGESVQEVTSYEGFSLTRRVSFDESDAQLLKSNVFRGRIQVVLDFRVQNVDNISVTMAVVHGEDSQANRAVDVVLVGTLVSLFVAAGVTAVLLSFWRDRLRPWTNTLCYTCGHCSAKRATYVTNPEEEDIDITYPKEECERICTASIQTDTLPQVDMEELRSVVRSEQQPLYDQMRKIQETLESTRNLYKTLVTRCPPRILAEGGPSTSWTASQKKFDTRMTSRNNSI